jgi:hypothetical protein
MTWSKLLLNPNNGTQWNEMMDEGLAVIWNNEEKGKVTQQSLFPFFLVICGGFMLAAIAEQFNNNHTLLLLLSMLERWRRKVSSFLFLFFILLLLLLLRGDEWMSIHVCVVVFQMHAVRACCRLPLSHAVALRTKTTRVSTAAFQTRTTCQMSLWVMLFTRWGVVHKVSLLMSLSWVQSSRFQHDTLSSSHVVCVAQMRFNTKQTRDVAF